MRRFLAFVCVLFLGLGMGHALAGPMEDLVAAAKKEGTINFYGPSSMTPQGAQALADALNKKYGTDIKMVYIPSGSMTKDVGKVVTRAAAGAPPEWDAMVATDAHHAELWLRKLHEPFEYKTLGVSSDLIDYDRGSITFANQYIVPVYNSKLVSAAEAPKKWEDLLDPKWKGKLGVTTATHHMSRLAMGPWGEEKTTAFVKAMAKQDPILGRQGETYSRLQVGEIVVAFTLVDSYVHRATRSGAPIVAAEEVQPVIAPAYHIGVIKGAAHPNTARLFAVFMTTPEAQKVWEKTNGQTSSLIPGTPYYEKAQGKTMIYMTQNQAKEVLRLRKIYSKMMGFR